MNAPPVFGFGPLDRWIDDDSVSEVLVNAGREVWIERADGPPGTHYVGRLDPGAIDIILERILTPVGRRLDRTSPVVDARLADGSRICAVLPPVSADGPCLAVRRFRRRLIDIDAFTTSAVGALVDQIVAARCNLLVSGATSSGKTSLLNAIAGLIAHHERIITLEDTAELQLRAPHVLRLECRPATADGIGEITMQVLLRAALRLRPDRLVVGEVRGAEASELVQALNTGHDGSMSTIHANSPVDALMRLESLVMQAGTGWSESMARDHVGRSVDVVVHVARSGEGNRFIEEVCEVGEPGSNQRARSLATGGVITGALGRTRR
jgi:pilus assembly protein CpaF